MPELNHTLIYSTLLKWGYRGRVGMILHLKKRMKSKKFWKMCNESDSPK